MDRVAIFAFTVIAAAIPAPSSAQGISPPDSEICDTSASSTPMINKNKLLRWALDQQGNVGRALDPAGQGVTLTTRLRAVLATDEYCKKAACTAEEKNGLSTIGDKLSQFANRSEDAAYKIELVRRPTTAEISRLQFLDQKISERFSDRPILLNEFLYQDPTFFRGICKQLAGEKTAQTKPDSTNFFEGVANNVRLRGTVDDLRIPREAPGFLKSDFATVSIANDNRASTRQYDVQAVIGYTVGPYYIGWTDLSVIPFAKYERRFTSGDNDEKRVNNVGFGLLGNMNFEIGYLNNDLSVYPLFTTDSEADTKITSLNLIYQPIPDWPYVQSYRTLGPFQAKAWLDLKLKYGHVIDDGGRAELENTDNFFQVGPKISLRLIGNADWLPKTLQFDISYQYLRGIEGQFDSLRRFETALQYIFPEQQNFSLELKFADGRAEDTFENEKFWKLGFGVRY